MSFSGETKSQRVLSNVIAGAIAAVVVVGAAIGTPVLVNASNAAHQEQVQQTADAKAATILVRAAGQQDAVLTESATQAGVIAQQEAEAKAAAEAAAQAAAAQAAADAAAAQAAQEAQAEQDAQTEPASDDSGSGTSGSSSSGEPSGTPLPMVQVTDPNNGQYGQMVPSVDPASWCANHSASTINGVPTCD